MGALEGQFDLYSHAYYNYLLDSKENGSDYANYKLGGYIVGSVALSYATPKLLRGEGPSLYHYTPEEAYHGILGSKKLYASSGIKNARHGNGQYFTDIAPSSIGAKSASSLAISQVQAGQISLGQLSTRLFGMPFNTRKLTHYIEIDVRGLDITNPKTNIFYMSLTRA